MAWRSTVQVAEECPVVWKLPPLILHPFAGEPGPDKLLDGSRANLALHGLLPDASRTHDDLTRLMLEGRYQEMKMLFYIGKDLLRWAEQCMDFIGRETQLKNNGIKAQSFVALLIEHPAPGTAAKLSSWGVHDQRAIFSRAVGLNTMFAEPPEIDTLSALFVKSYQRFADYLYIAYQTMTSYTPLQAESFQFELYASLEYANLLAKGWNMGE